MTTKSTPLTQHAVRNMCLGKPLMSEEPLIVQVFNSQQTNHRSGSSSGSGGPSESSVIVYDGQDFVTATVVLGPLTFAVRNSVVTNSSRKVAVYSYICSEANSSKDGPPPFLCIIPMSIESQEPNIPNLTGRRPFSIPAGAKIKGGIAPKFFASMAPVLSSQALCGQASASSVRRESSSQQNAKIVADFLAKQSAMTTLAQSNNDNSNHANNSDSNNSNHATQYYMSALREFQASQVDRQKSTLTSNAGREDAQKSALIVRQHNKALTQALADTSQPLSSALLCRWHAILCGEGVLADANAAGVVRTKNVRVGHVHFRPHSLVQTDLDSLCQSMQCLEQRLLHQAGPNAAQRAGVEAATFAACVFFGIGDVHAFCDGNGRLARLALQWALKRAGIPFCLHLFATPTQRKEYVQATVQTRRNLALMGQGQFSQEDLVHAYEAAGALGPLVDLILDRLAKTIAEFEKVVQTKSRLVTEEAEARAAKAVRDRERAGSCLICFDDNPNIGTLCCGKAVHLNCVAQWLSSNNTCPNCREEFPALPPRMRAPQAAANDQQQADDTTSVDSDDDTTEMMEEEEEDDTVAMHARVLAAARAHQMMEEEVDDTVAMHARVLAAILAHEQRVAARAAQGIVNNNHEDDDTTEDDDDGDETTEDDATTIAQQQQQQQQDDTSSDTESTTDDSTTANAGPSSSRNDNHLPPFCVMNNCSNRSARDCSNNTCGRCCMMHGQYSCARHNT